MLFGKCEFPQKTVGFIRIFMLSIPEYGKRIRLAREKSNLEIYDIAVLLDITWESASDLEAFDDEVLTCISIKKFLILCNAIQVTPVELLSQGSDVESFSKITFDELTHEIRKYLTQNNLTLIELENKVGWNLGEALSKPEIFFQYNLDCLKLTDL